MLPEKDDLLFRGIFTLVNLIGYIFAGLCVGLATYKCCQSIRKSRGIMCKTSFPDGGETTLNRQSQNERNIANPTGIGQNVNSESVQISSNFGGRDDYPPPAYTQ